MCLCVCVYSIGTSLFCTYGTVINENNFWNNKAGYTWFEAFRSSWSTLSKIIEKRKKKIHAGLICNAGADEKQILHFTWPKQPDLHLYLSSLKHMSTYIITYSIKSYAQNLLVFQLGNMMQRKICLEFEIAYFKDSSMLVKIGIPFQVLV